MLLKAVIDGDAARHTSRKRRGVMSSLLVVTIILSDEVNRPSVAHRPLSLKSKTKDSHRGDERL